MSDVRKYESEVGLMKQSGVGRYVKLGDYETLESELSHLKDEFAELKENYREAMKAVNERGMCIDIYQRKLKELGIG